MKEYMFLFRGGDMHQENPVEAEAHMQLWAVWMGDLAKAGKLVGAQPLNAGGMQISGTGKVLSDGPFAEGKEFVGGYLICKAATMEEAVAIGKDCPILMFENGNVEVREVQYMEIPT